MAKRIRDKPVKDEKTKITVSMVMPMEMYSEFKAKAEAERRTFSNFVIGILDNYLKL